MDTTATFSNRSNARRAAELPLPRRVRAPARERRPEIKDRGRPTRSLPITLGTVLIAEGLLTYLGPQGWVNRLLIESGLASSPIRLTHRAA